VFKKSSVTGADGVFQFDDVPISHYGLALKVADEWKIMIGSDCCEQMEPGKTYELPSISLE
jgi:hypothetical protein